MRNLFRFAGLVAAPVWLLLGSIREAKAQFVTSDPPVEMETLAIHLQQVLQYAQELKTAIATYQHLQLMIREVQQLATHPSTNIAMDLATFSSALAQSQAIALNVAQMDATFQNPLAPGLTFSTRDLCGSIQQVGYHVCVDIDQSVIQNQ